MLRPEYELMQRLAWDSDVRRDFLADPRDAVRQHYPALIDLERFGPQQFCGVEETAYYRIASACRASKAVFPRGHQLLMAYGGLRFFEVLLKNYLDAPRPRDAVYEVFDGYALGPHTLNITRSYDWPSGGSWIQPILEYEWARWHIDRILQGWSPLVPARGRFGPGTLFISAEYDLKAMLSEIDRMVSAWVPAEVYRWRAVPGEGEFHVAIFGRDDSVAEVELDRVTITLLREIEREPHFPIESDLEAALIDIGLLQEV